MSEVSGLLGVLTRDQINPAFVCIQLMRPQGDRFDVELNRWRRIYLEDVVHRLNVKFVHSDL